MTKQSVIILLLGQLFVVLMALLAMAIYSQPETKISRFEFSAEQIQRLH